MHILWVEQSVYVYIGMHGYMHGLPHPTPPLPWKCEAQPRSVRTGPSPIGQSMSILLNRRDPFPRLGVSSRSPVAHPYITAASTCPFLPPALGLLPRAARLKLVENAAGGSLAAPRRLALGALGRGQSLPPPLACWWWWWRRRPPGCPNNAHARVGGLCEDDSGCGGLLRGRGDVEPCVLAPWLDMVSETQRSKKRVLGVWSGPQTARSMNLGAGVTPEFDIFCPLSKCYPSPAAPGRGRRRSPYLWSILDCIVPSQTHARATGRAARIFNSRRPKTRAICGWGGKKMSLARAAAKASVAPPEERREQSTPQRFKCRKQAEGEQPGNGRGAAAGPAGALRALIG